LNNFESYFHIYIYIYIYIYFINVNRAIQAPQGERAAGKTTKQTDNHHKGGQQGGPDKGIDSQSGPMDRGPTQKQHNQDKTARGKTHGESNRHG
jgi:hypothetical protein